MDEQSFDHAVKTLAGRAARRDALRSLGAAGLAALAGIGLAKGGDAKKHQHGGAKRHNNARRQKNPAKEKPEAPPARPRPGQC
jgi:hypothetical protein